MSTSKDRDQRRLSAVLMADIVGYTKLVEHDTDRTVTAWKAARLDVIDPLIEQMRGRIVKFTGDGFLAEFQTVQDAVNCAMSMQNQLDSSPLTFRMGVNLGDVIDDGDDIHGEGVNIAARIEALAEPGSITISGSVFEQVRNRISANYKDMGERDLKHVSAPIHVFQIYNITQKADENPTREPSPKPETEAIQTYKKSAPRILVSPFRNNSRNGESEEIVEGIVEDLTTELSQIRALEVISNGASATLDVKKEALDGLHDAHGIDFVLTGSIRSSGERLRVSVELLDATDSTVIWSERFNETFDDIFEIQDRIVQKTIFFITGEIEVKTLERAHRKPTENMTSYELLIKGKRLHHQYRKETHPVALEYFNKAIEADPENSAAYAWRACTIGGCLNRGFLPASNEISSDSVQASIAKAKELNAEEPECYRMLCRATLRWERNLEKALQFGKKAYELNPNDPRILLAYGKALALSGFGHEASNLLQKAEQLTPNFGVEGTKNGLWSGLVLSTFVDQKYAECLDWYQKLDDVDFQSFVLGTYSASQQQVLDAQRQSHLENLAQFQSLDHAGEIDDFLFKDQQTTEDLKAFCTDLFS